LKEVWTLNIKKEKKAMLGKATTGTASTSHHEQSMCPWDRGRIKKYTEIPLGTLEGKDGELNWGSMNWGLKISKTLTISLYENYVVLRL
jgi:hypothetical protein